MKKFWKSDPMYASFGVDGSSCSIVTFLSEYEAWCPLMKGRKPREGECNIPKNPEYPNCADKVGVSVFLHIQPALPCYIYECLSYIFIWYCWLTPPDHLSRWNIPVCLILYTGETVRIILCIWRREIFVDFFFLQWMKKFWLSDPCYKRLGVNGSVCSFISYLGEVFLYK